jgi:hypothetical protein
MITTLRKFGRTAAIAGLLTTASANLEAGTVETRAAIKTVKSEQAEINAVGLPKYIEVSKKYFFNKEEMTATLSESPVLRSIVSGIATANKSSYATDDKIWSARGKVINDLPRIAHKAQEDIGFGVKWSEAAPEKQARALFKAEHNTYPKSPTAIVGYPTRKAIPVRQALVAQRAR